MRFTTEHTGIFAIGLTLIMGLALGLRLFGVFGLEAGPQDAMPVVDSYNYTGAHDPVSLVLGHFFRLFVNKVPLWLFRLPGTIADMILIALVAVRMSRRDGVVAGWLVAGLLAVSFSHVVISTTVRGYGIHILGTWLMFLDAERLVQHKDGGRLLVLGSILALGHHWVVPFGFMGLSLLAWWLARHQSDRQDKAWSTRWWQALISAFLIVLFATILWSSQLLIIPLKNAYQTGSPDLNPSRLAMLVHGLDINSRVLAGGSILAAFALATLVGMGRVAAQPRLLLVVTALYFAVPIMVDLIPGSFGHQVGHIAFLVIPLAIWSTRGAMAVANRLTVSRHRVFVPMIATLALTGAFIWPNFSSDIRLIEQGHHVAMGYSFEELNAGVRLRMLGDDIVLMNSDDFFLASHLFAEEVENSPEDKGTVFITDRLLGTPLFRRFILHEFSRSPDWPYDLHEWQDIEGFSAGHRVPGGRIIAVLPNIDPRATGTWLSGQPASKGRSCIGVPKMPDGITIDIYETGFIAWADIGQKSVGQVADLAKVILSEYSKACWK